MSKDIFKYILENEYKKRKIEIIPENREVISKEINIPTTTENEQITYKSTQNNIDNISNNYFSSTYTLNMNLMTDYYFRILKYSTQKHFLK